MQSKEERFSEVLRNLLELKTIDLRGEVFQKAILETLIEIRDILSERHTRREKEKVCEMCDGHGEMPEVEYELRGENKAIPTYKLVPCPSCHPANTN